MSGIDLSEAGIRDLEGRRRDDAKWIDEEENKGYFTVMRSLRVVSALIVLECTLLTSYTTLILRMTGYL